MKKQFINLSFSLSFLFSAVYCFGNNVTDTAGQPVRRLPLLPPSHELKEAEEKIVTIDQDITAKQAAFDAVQPDLEKAKSTFENYHSFHGDKPTEGQVAQCESYYQTYIDVNNNASGMLDDIIDLKQQKKDQEDLMKEKKQEFIDAMTGKSLCVVNLSTSSTYEELMNCWRCFFDGDCRDLPPLPDDPRPPFVVVPNTGGATVPGTGAPSSFNVLSQQQRDNYNVYNKPAPPLPKTDPPQKGYIEQATEKVRSYFQNLINSSKRIKNRVTAVLAVRG